MGHIAVDAFNAAPLQLGIHNRIEVDHQNGIE
jgi:hypothetical protein